MHGGTARSLSAILTPLLLILSASQESRAQFSTFGSGGAKTSSSRLESGFATNVDANVDFSSGEATLQLPIEVPKGTGGLEPSLGLYYSSLAGDGVMGMGWSLPLSEVARDARFGIPAFNDATDRFALDGELLVRNASGEFRTFTETFQKIIHVTAGGLDYWEVTAPNGSTARYGTTKQTQVRRGGSTNPVGDSGPIAQWLLSELEDVNGNVVWFTYDRSLDVGIGYPNEIQYTYRGGAPGTPGTPVGELRMIKFLYESRDDATVSFAGSVRAELRRRLKEIQTTVGGSAFRRYLLEYDETPYSTKRSRLTSTRIFGTDCPVTEPDPVTYCAGLPPQTYTYSDPTEVLPPGQTSTQWQSQWPDTPGVNFGKVVPGNFIPQGWQLGDVNGDGYPDLIRAMRDVAGAVYHQVILNDGAKWDVNHPDNQAWSNALAAITFPSYKLNVENHFPPYFCNSNLIPTTSQVYFQNDFQKEPIPRIYHPPGEARLVDINADGFIDIVISFEIGAGHVPPESTTLIIPPCSSSLTTTGQSVRGVWINQGPEAIGWQKDEALSANLPIFESTYFTNHHVLGPFLTKACAPSVTEYFALGADRVDTVNWYVHDHGVRFVELNGDDRPDLVARRDAFWLNPSPAGPFREFPASAWINTGSDWVEQAQWTPPVSIVGAAPNFGVASHTMDSSIKDADVGVRFVDLNGDGLDDLVKTPVADRNPSGPSVPNPPASFGVSGVWLNTGSGWCGPQDGCAEAARYLPPAGQTFSYLSSEPDCPIPAPYSGSAFDWVTRSTELIYADVNGDGTPDLVRSDGSTPSYDPDPTIEAWIFSPGETTGTVWVSDSRFRPSMESVATWGGYTITKGVLVADIDGNGAADFVRYNDYGGANLRAGHLAQTTYPDRLRAVDNGAGGLVTYDYQSAIRQRDSTLEAEAALDSQSLAEDDPQLLVRWEPTPVVSSRTVVGLENEQEPFATEFSYARPLWCPTNRSSLGFRTVETTQRDRGGLIEFVNRSFFWQAHGRAGALSRREIRSAQGSLLRKEVFDWEVVPDSSQIPGSIAGVRIGRKIHERLESWHGGVAGAARDVTFDYNDAYGYNFASSIVIARPTGTLNVVRTPRAADTASWIVGLAASEAEFDGGTQQLLGSRTFLYDQFGGGARGFLTNVQELVQPRDGGTPAVAETQWEFDAFGNLIRRRDAEARDRYFCYDGDADLGPTESCPASLTTTHTVLAGSADPVEVGGVAAFEVDLATGGTRKVTKHNGDEVILLADPFGRIEQRWVKPAAQSQATLTRAWFFHDGLANPAGRPYVEQLDSIDATSSIRSATYFDGLGQAVRAVYETPTGSGYAGQAIVRDHLGRPVRETYPQPCTDAHCSNLPVPNSSETVTTYDPLGRILLLTTPDGTTAFQYGSQSRPNPLGGAALVLDRLVSMDAEGNLSQRFLDANRVVFSDECHQTVSTIGPCTTTPDTTFYAYEATGEIRAIYDPIAFPGSMNDPNHRIAYRYDTLGRVLEVFDPDLGGSTRSQRTTYDLVGNVDTVTNARGQLTDFDYDDLNRTIDIDRPAGEKDLTISYDPSTRRRSAVNEVNGYALGYEYDDFGREKHRTLAINGRTFHLNFQYDLLGRVTQIYYPINATFASYRYSGAYLDAMCAGSSIDKCEQTQPPAGVHWIIHEVIYDALGRPTQIVGQPGVLTETFDPSTYRLRTRWFTNDASQDALTLNYYYDPNGSVDVITDGRGSTAFDGIHNGGDYEYDSLNRLKSVELYDGEVTKHFGYDPLGNLIIRDGANPGTQNQFYDAAHPHRIAQNHAGAPYEYDDDGNVTRRGGQYYQYNEANQLVCAGSAPSTPCNQAQVRYDLDGGQLELVDGIANPSRAYFGEFFEWHPGIGTGVGMAMQYYYAFGRRIMQKKIENANPRVAAPVGWLLPVPPEDLPWVIGLLVSGGLAILLVRLGALQALRERPATAGFSLVVIASLLVPPKALAGGYIPGIGLITTRYLFTDHLGSVILATDSVGNVTHRRMFEPFGKIVYQFPSEPTANFFTDHQFQPAIGMNNFGARWYDSEAGRFASIDPIIQGIADPQTANAYSYVRNDPINLIDPDGLGFLKKLKKWFKKHSSGSVGGCVGACQGYGSGPSVGFHSRGFDSLNAGRPGLVFSGPAFRQFGQQLGGLLTPAPAPVVVNVPGGRPGEEYPGESQGQVAGDQTFDEEQQDAILLGRAANALRERFEGLSPDKFREEFPSVRNQSDENIEALNTAFQLELRDIAVSNAAKATLGGFARGVGLPLEILFKFAITRTTVGRVFFTSQNIRTDQGLLKAAEIGCSPSSGCSGRVVTQRVGP